jgi:hypothetical protein
VTMSLLYKYGLRIDAVEGGIVRVKALRRRMSSAIVDHVVCINEM